MTFTLGSRRNQELKEIETLISAIESLKPTENIFKDYIYPMVAPFLSTLFGAWAGYTASVKKQSRDNEVQKLQSLNKLLLHAESNFRSLEAIKDNYSNTIDSSPLRGMSFGPLVLDYEKANTDLSNLVFLTKAFDNNIKNISKNRLAFNNLYRIKQIFHNFNQVMAIWNQRNVEVKPIFEKLRSEAVAGVVEGIDINDLFKKINKEDIAVVCHLTENALKLTDVGLKELLGLMQELPDLAKSCFKRKFLKEEGGILSYLNEPSITGKILKKVPDIDVDASIMIFGADLSA